ncbi:MAG TPA: BON domain-containing protein [Vicinamibacterales bacterium]|nr:BON domain-containing protein [Vicinamibacterales bacterium]
MTDRDLQRHVQDALEWDPSIDATDIGVSVADGVVTLRGDVHTFAEQSAAEKVALRVYGVKGVANDVKVRLEGMSDRTDTEVAQAALNALKWTTTVPGDTVTVTVSNGWLTLRGTVDWQYQKDAAFRTVRDLAGVRGVTNDIVLKPRVKAGDVQAKIEAAFRRNAEIDARRISVNVLDGKVILSGNVHSWSERNEAKRAAWAAPGVTTVDDNLVLVP